MDQQTFITVVDYTGTRSGGDAVPPVIGTAPTSLTATADTDSIELDWTNNDTYTSIVIERKTTGEYEALATAAGDVETYDDTTAIAGTTYTYKVRGVKGGYPTPYTNEASDTIPVSAAASASFDGGASDTLISASGSALNRTDQTAIIIGAWVKFNSDSTIALSHIAGKFRSDDTPDFSLTMSPADSKKIRFHALMNQSTSFVDADTDAVQNILYYYVGYIDPVNKLIGVSINGAAFKTFDYTADDGPLSADNGVFEVGGQTEEQGATLDGLIDEVYVCKDPSDFAAALVVAQTTIYNSGTGKRYEALSAGNKTTLGLVSWWGLDEASGNRLDLHGNLVTLVPTGVAQGAALVS